MATAYVDDRPSQFAQILAHLLDVVAHLGAYFDLRTEQLSRYLTVENFFALTNQRLRRIDLQSPGLLIDQEVLLLNAQGECGFVNSHCLPPNLPTVMGVALRPVQIKLKWQQPVTCIRPQRRAPTGLLALMLRNSMLKMTGSVNIVAGSHGYHIYAGSCGRLVLMSVGLRRAGKDAMTRCKISQISATPRSSSIRSWRISRPTCGKPIDSA